MKKVVMSLVLTLFIIGLVNGGVIINEVMAEPSITAEEWVELYSDVDIELIDWIIADGNSNDTFSLNISAGSYGLIIDNALSCSSFSISNESCIEIPNIGNGLNNDGDEVYLYDNNSILIDSFDYDSSTSNISWQYCSGTWMEHPSTPNAVNNCTVATIEDTSSNEEVTLHIDWVDEEIINGEEFEIEIEIDNMEDKIYNIKVWIENDDGDVMTDRYDSGEEEWKSGIYYVDDFFEGPEDDNRKIKLRFSDDYNDFDGDVTIFAKLEGESKIEENIEVLESETVAVEDDFIPIESTTTEITENTTSQTIKLGDSKNSSELSSEKDDSIIYKSKNEYIKEYSIYGFALLCIGLIVLLIIDK